MKHVIEQLESVRRTGRFMLIFRRIMQALTAVIIAALVCGFLDYLLRLPGWLRLFVGLAFAACLSVWLVTHLGRAFGFRPELSQLALRAERLFPQLAGALASGVEFASHPEEYADPQRTAQLASSSADAAETRLGRESLRKLLNPTPTVRTGALALLMVLLLTAVVIATPDGAALAAKRWFLPLSDAEWPRRTHIKDLVPDAPQPADSPLGLSAKIDRGYAPGMRAWAYYRIKDLRGEYRQWKSVLMSEQASAVSPKGNEPAAKEGVFERLIDLTGDLTDIMPGESAYAGLPAEGTTVEYYFRAGDDFTEPREVRLVPRPAVTGVTLSIEPPAYAKGLVQAETIALDKQLGRTASASGLEGSQVRLTVTLNKPVIIPSEGEQAAINALMPAFRDIKGATFNYNLPRSFGTPPSFEITFILRKTVESPIRLIDSHGLTPASDRLYRVEARIDQQPTVAMLQPPGDESVLATATVKLDSLARDDVAIESLSLEAALPLAPSQPAPGAPELRILESVTGRSERLTASHELDLSKLGLKPGDSIVLTAIAQDIFELDSVRHDPVRSSPRTLRIVDAATLINQLRNDLAGLRQQAMRLQTRQQEIKDNEPAQAQPRQQQLTQTFQREEQLVDQLDARMKRNKLDDVGISELLNRARGHLNEAQKESKAAEGKLDQARRAQQDSKDQKDAKAQAGQHQDKVEAALKDLTNLLDEGKSAAAIQAQLRQLDHAQKQLAEQTRAMLPRTAGQKPEDLNPQDKKELDKLAQEQKNLAQQAQDLVQQMKAAAEAINKQSEDPQDKAQAQALNEAANIAQRQGLEEKMQQAAQDAKENKLSQAGGEQEEASQTMSQMLQQMQGAGQKQQEILKRMLVKLEDAIQKLIAQQKAQLARLREVKELPPLADAQSALRRNTLSVAEDARASEKTAGVAKLLDDAAAAQSDAIFFLRGAQLEPAATSETEAVSNLEAALQLVRDIKKKQEEEETQKQRDELKVEYEKLAKEQDALRQRTLVLLGQKELDRRQRAELLQLGNSEADLKIEANKLREKVKDTLIFQHLHQQIDDTASKVVSSLRATEATERVVLDQQEISDTLRVMAQALEDAKKDDNPFDTPQSGDGQGQQQQQGQQQPRPLVPPIAELRLLRGLQDSVYKQTRDIGEGRVQLTPPQRNAAIQSLSQQQGQLQQLGEKLIQKMSQQAVPGGLPPVPPPDPGQPKD
ncbi:MAG: hypothetical protein WD768_21450 [Phycisphaeraceae bacterium]